MHRRCLQERPRYEGDEAVGGVYHALQLNYSECLARVNYIFL